MRKKRVGFLKEKEKEGRESMQAMIRGSLFGGCLLTKNHSPPTIPLQTSRAVEDIR
jgi:hypothetical protein